MSSEALQQQLQAGISALKSGDRERARQLLLAVVQADERQEEAWLWLSGAVDTAVDKRICLENVLTLNPNNEKARRNLDRLTAVASPPTKTVITQKQPLTPAAAILHPERYEPVTEEREIIRAPATANVAYQADSTYDDVWSRQEDLCPYCAHVIDHFDEKCPGCGRSLIRRRFRYEKPSANLHLFWVMLVGIGQLFLIKMLFLVLAERAILPAVVNGSLMLLFMLLALGIYLRQTWVLFAAYLILIGVLIVALVNFATPLDLSPLGLATLDEALGNTVSSLIAGFGRFLEIFLITATIIALILGVFSVSPDFERVRVRQLAVLRKGLSTASDYSHTARRLARAQMWAAAVLHWQRAAAKEPMQSAHLLALGQAYAHLGFYERALDVLQSALKLVSHPDRRREIKNTITAVTTKQETVP